MKDDDRGQSWAQKIQRSVERALDTGEPHFEVHDDGHSFVSILTVDVCGDNTLVYLTRAKTEKLIEQLQRAVGGLPQRRKPTARKGKRP